ncbi:hypothetical protein Tco_0611087 [Tanacetum coccineum]
MLRGVNHQNILTHPHHKGIFVPTTIATKSGQVLVNAAKQSSPRAATSISTARPVNTATPKLKVNDALPTTYSYFKAHSPIRRTFNQKSATKINNFNEKVNTPRVNNVTTVGPKAVVSVAEGNRENAVKSSDQGIFDSGCSRHIKGNKSFPYKIIKRLGNGGFVALEEVPKGRGNLVRGLPSKLFENDHTCVACQKGKQHKASCIKDIVDAVPTQQYILLPLLSDSPHSSEDVVADDAGKKTTEEPANKGERINVYFVVHLIDDDEGSRADRNKVRKHHDCHSFSHNKNSNKDHPKDRSLGRHKFQLLTKEMTSRFLKNMLWSVTLTSREEQITKIIKTAYLSVFSLKKNPRRRFKLWQIQAG